MTKKIIAIVSLFIIIILVVGGVYFYTQRRASLTSNPDLASTPTPSENPDASPILVDAPKDPITSIIVTDSDSPTTVTLAANKTALPVDTEMINVVLILDPASPASAAVLTMTYIADESTLGPVTADIKTIGGRKMAGFVITKPTTDWPNGPYTFTAVLSTGESKETMLILQ